MNLKKLERYLQVNLLGPGPRFMKKEFTRPRSDKDWETLLEECSKQRDIGIYRSSVTEVGSLEILTIQSECTAVDRTYCSARVIGWGGGVLRGTRCRSLTGKWTVKERMAQGTEEMRGNREWFSSFGLVKACGWLYYCCVLLMSRTLQ
jgi:hypothetical protein